MLVPFVAVRHLHEAHAAARQTAGPSGIAGRSFPWPGRRARTASASLGVSRLMSCRSGAVVCMRKASSNELMRPSSAESGPVALQVLLVHFLEQIELQPLHVARRAVGVLDERNLRLVGRDARVAERRALIRGRKKRRAVVVHAAVRQRGTDR